MSAGVISDGEKNLCATPDIPILKPQRYSFGTMKTDVSNRKTIEDRRKKTEEKLSGEERELLNLIAEMAVQIILKNIENECDRLYQDQ